MSRRWGRAESEGALVMNEAIVLPHWLREERKTKVTTVGSQVGMIRGNKRYIQNPCCYQPCWTKDHRVYQVDNIRRKSLETTYKERTKEVHPQFWIKRKRYSSSADDFGASIHLYTTLWAQKQALMSASL